MTNTNDIVSGVYIRLGTANIPSEITSGDIIDLANDRIIDINGFSGRAISGNDIPSDMVTSLKDLVTADIVARSLGINIDTQISVGNIRLEYRDKLAAENAQISFYLNKAQRSLNNAGKRILQNYTVKVS